GKEGIETEVGSLEGLYTLRDSRGRPDRVAFEGRLVTAAGVLWVQRQRSHYRDKRAPLMELHYDLTKITVALQQEGPGFDSRLSA
ncbi:hypothetical protein AMECASPLE_015483, partial [Ameca splendens]